MKEVYSDNTQLIQALKKGDPKAYTYLVNSYHHKLCVYAYSFTHDHNLSEDIVQNVFMRIWNKRENLKDEFSIINFLYRSVYNEFIDQYRSQKSFYPLEKKYIDALNTIVETEDEHSLERIIKLVKREIQNLPPKCKEIFLLSKEEGLTNIEIAEYKNVSIKSVEAHITKAFSILRNSLGEKADLYLFLMFR
ncbi:RNA polymerase sigma-70 factor, ECF subfamily [Flavobacterium glycines]|jgi:RNA polymerase sigma-70 factor (ECF subfamily)|uniref:DNA-directed RNA polymerase sigma-70 factor n=1 Tax=Flavobacterium glycines TaxID=551990 RepID=A0A1B9DYH0_9FLAO|nr:RNA polymerase sigma-70 factor [Flavobacterium glycines]OCB74745.1 LuxR family transcriptional regulator [Flavobacterium glycines]GEL09275.1 DNA-directed RNA polymerase sigma-70 factor [Flavobacterium glycines]SDJ12725.1 RNA polymerase sigma-70 factor, ECF subfamily [Flavobacterium glycines]